ncbi:MAG: hypothetical protein WAQ05_21185 [Rubrivivax sp.]
MQVSSQHRRNVALLCARVAVASAICCLWVVRDAPAGHDKAGARQRAQQQFEPSVSVASDALLHRAGAKEELEKLKRKLKGEKQDDTPPAGPDAAAANAAPGAAPACRPNTDVVAEVTKEPCDQYQKSPNTRIWVRTSWPRGAVAVVDVTSLNRSGKESVYTGTDVAPPGRHFTGVCGIKATVKSCSLSSY